MMKKLLVLMLVLATSSLASAALMLNVPAQATVGEDFTVTLSGLASDLGGKSVDLGLYGDGAGLVKASEVAPIAGVSGLMSAYDPGWGGFELTAGEAVDNGNAGDNPQDGIWFTLTASSAVEGVFTFDLYEYAVSYDVPTQSASITIVPEPMSLALLGLGGLFLRRRK